MSEIAAGDPKRVLSRLGSLEDEIERLRAINAELLAELRDTRNELFWCAEQLKVRGFPGVTGDSVDRALANSAALLAKAKGE